MKIIFLNRFFFPDHSATSQILTDLAFYLVARGHEVHVITSRQRYDNPEALLQRLESVNGVEVHRVWTSRFGRGSLLGRALDYFSFYVSAAWCLFWLLARGDVVVAKTDPPMLSVIAAAICKLRGARLINWLQDVFPEVATALGMKAMQGKLGDILLAVRNSSLRSASMNVVLGERMRLHVVGQGVASDKVCIIHNWADGNAIQPSVSTGLRRAWGLEGKFVVGYSGNIGRAHDLDTILGAAELLKDDHSIAFLFIGGGHGKEMIEQVVQDKVLNNVQFRPYQPRESLKESLGLPDVHLVTLKPELEGLIVPSKFYGIAAAGRGVLFVGDPQGEIGKIVEAANCGKTVAIGEHEKLAGYISKLKNETGLAKEWGDNARAVFEARFDSKIPFELWDELINSPMTK